MIKRSHILAILIFLSFFSGCATHAPKGPVFTQHKMVTKENALIYFYRTDDESFGWARFYYIRNGNEDVATMKVGGYFPYEVKPGKVYLSSGVIDTADLMVPLLFHAADLSQRKGPAFLEFEAKSGEIYFVRFKPIPDTWTFHPTLQLVPAEEGMETIKAEKLIIRHKHETKKDRQ